MLFLIWRDVVGHQGMMTMGGALYKKRCMSLGSRMLSEEETPDNIFDPGMWLTIGVAE
jgi:hypothetical protein